MAAPTGSMGLLAVIMVSGGVALLVLGSHKLLEPTIQSNSSFNTLSSGKNLAKKKKKKKKVHFAEELEECFGEKQDGDREVAEECRRDCAKFEGHPVEEKRGIAGQNIPANRMALYNGMLRYRMNQASLYM